MLLQMLQMLRTLRKDDRGVTAIEYGLLAALIAVAIIAVILLVQGGLSTTFNTVGTQLQQHGS